MIETTDDIYRRRIEIRVGPERVEAAMEDYIHHFAIRLHHDGVRILAVELSTERTPWSTCREGARGLSRLIGTPISEVADVRTWIGERRDQCVHTTDLAMVAATAVLRGADRDYELRMSGIGHPERSITLWIDDVQWATWVIAENAIVDDHRSGRFAGLPLDAGSFSRWMADLLGPDERESAALLRRASSIGLGRGVPIDSWHDASEGMNPLESCHTYRADVVFTSRRNRGTTRRTEDDPLGTPLPVVRDWEHLRPSDRAD